MIRKLLAVATIVLATGASAQIRLPGKIPRIPVNIPGVGNIPGLDKLLGNEPALTTNIADARTEIAFLDDFAPVYPRPLPSADRSGGVALLPGAYSYVAQSYCLHAGTYGPRGSGGGPRGGAGYLYAPLRGSREQSVAAVLRRSAEHPEIPQNKVQVLVWAIIAKSKLSDMSPDRQRVAAQLLTPQELFELNGGALGLIPEDLKRQALSKLTGPLRQVFEAEDKIRRLVTQANSSFAELERVAVLAGDPPPQPGDRTDVPRKRWAYAPAGYFVRYDPSKFTTTTVEIYVPERFDVRRDDLGRIVSIEDPRGNRIEAAYRSGTSRSVNSAPLRAFSFTSVGFMQKRHQPLQWQNRGWTLSGNPSGSLSPAGATDDMSGLPERLAKARERRAEFERIIANGSRSRGTATGATSELADLANFHDALNAALPSDIDPTRRAMMLNEVMMAWQSVLAQALGPKPPRVASLIPMLFAATPIPSAQAATSFDPSGDVAVPGEAGRQRLGQSARKNCDDKAQCSSLSKASTAATAGISPKKSAAIAAVQPPFGKNLKDALNGAKKNLCGDKSAEDSIDAMLHQLEKLKTDAKSMTVSDVVDNNSILQTISDELQDMSDSKCGGSPPSGDCSVPDLTDLTGSTKDEENHKGPDEKNLSDEMKSDLACLRQTAAKNGVVVDDVDISSAYRSKEYQKHLWEIFDRYGKLLNNRNPACDALRAKIEAEMRKHAIIGQPKDPNNDPRHSAGGALDLSGTDGTFMDMIASCCQTFRRYGSKDPVHFEPCPKNCDDLTANNPNEQQKQRDRCAKYCSGDQCLQGGSMTPGGVQ